MAGVPKFDRAQALNQAAGEFADRGYQGTSVSHLVAATGLLRGSLYGAFDSKSELFRAGFEEALNDASDTGLLIDLLVVALRERAADDPRVAALATRAIEHLQTSGRPVATQVYERLVERAGISPDTA